MEIPGLGFETCLCIFVETFNLVWTQSLNCTKVHISLQTFPVQEIKKDGKQKVTQAPTDSHYENKNEIKCAALGGVRRPTKKTVKSDDVYETQLFFFNINN